MRNLQSACKFKNQGSASAGIFEGLSAENRAEDRDVRGSYGAQSSLASTAPVDCLVLPGQTLPAEIRTEDIICDPDDILGPSEEV